MELTKERLQEIAEDGFLKHGEAKAMARQLLAGMEQEPVAYMQIDGDDVEYNGHNEFSGGGKGVPLYAAPQLPQPAVPEDAFEVALSVLNDTLDDCGDSERGLLLALDRMGIEVRSDAMLQGAEPPAYEIKRFGEFGANGLTRDGGELAISIQLFHFERGTTPQPVRGGGIVEKYALQAIINVLQQQCDRLSDAPIPVIWPAAPQQEAENG